MMNFVYNEFSKSWCLAIRFIHFSTAFFDIIYENYKKVCLKVTSDKKHGIFDDQQILSKMAQGDAVAFEQLIRKYYQWLTVIVQVKYPKMDFHEDVVHETFLLVYEKIQFQQIKNPAQIKPFMRTCAINIAHQFYRKAKRHQSSIKQEHLVMIENSTQELSEWYELRSRKKLAIEMIKQMSVERDRLILKYHYFDQLDKTAVCKKLNLSHEHYDKVLYRARMRLKEMINDHIKLSCKGDNKLKSNLAVSFLVFITFFGQAI